MFDKKGRKCYNSSIGSSLRALEPLDPGLRSDLVLCTPTSTVEHIVHIDGVTGSSPVSTTTSSAEAEDFFGALAQLVARLNGIQKVRGSTPLCSTIKGLKL